VGHTVVSELSLWKGIYFGDGSSTLGVLRGKPNMDRMAVSFVGLRFFNSTNLLSELLKDLRM